MDVLYDINNEIALLRHEVFVEEQGVTEEEEYDGNESDFIHFCMYENEELIGYARASVKEGTIHIGRVVIRKDKRKHGYGKEVVLFAEEYGIRAGCRVASLNSQIQAKGFYDKLGYEADGEVFIEAGIDHIRMSKNLAK